MNESCKPQADEVSPETRDNFNDLKARAVITLIVLIALFLVWFILAIF